MNGRGRGIEFENRFWVRKTNLRLHLVAKNLAE